MMDDTTQQVPAEQTGTPVAADTTGEVITPAPAPKETGTQTEVAPQNPVVPEKTIPYSRFKEVTQKLRDLQRQLGTNQNQSQVTLDDDYESRLMNDPRMVELRVKDAMRQISDYTKEKLDEPRCKALPPQVKKMFLSLVRGAIKEDTPDIETAKVDIDDKLEEMLLEYQTPAATEPQKGFPIAATNSGTTKSGSAPEDIQKIMDKNLLDISGEEAGKLEKYLASQKRKTKS